MQRKSKTKTWKQIRSDLQLHSAAISFDVMGKRKESSR